MNTATKSLLAIAVIVLIGLGVWQLGGKTGGSAKEPVARVNGELIASADYEAMREQLLAIQGMTADSVTAENEAAIKSQVIETLVTQTILRQAALDASVVVTDENVDAEIERITMQIGGEEALDSALSEQGLARADFRAQVGRELLAQAYLEQTLALSTLTATEEEVDTAYVTLTESSQAAGGEEIPPLEEVRGQVEEYVIQQKSQQAVNAHLAELRAAAQVEVL